MLIKKMKLVLLVVVVADIITLILDYSTIYAGVFTWGWSTYNLIEFVSMLTH